MLKGRKALVCSVAYGMGHNAAAAALEEEWKRRGGLCCVVDPCAEAHPFIYELTRRFYHFCVRRAPWLWGVTYAQTDTADWRRAVHYPLLSDVARRLKAILEREQPDVVFCTYPLYAYMLDALHAQGVFHGRYAMVVTDSLVISRPWLQSQAPWVFVPDELSAAWVCREFGLPEARVQAAGFPVRTAFAQSAPREAPDASHLRILYGACRSNREVVHIVRALAAAFPAMRLVLLAGEREHCLRRALRREIAAAQVCVSGTTGEMAAYLAQSHFYIGKAGAATMFECYAAQVPMIVNFALPGQEQGNLQLLLHDGAGYNEETPSDVVHRVAEMLAQGAAGWQRARAAMKAAQRSGGAAAIVDAVERSFAL